MEADGKGHTVQGPWFWHNSDMVYVGGDSVELPVGNVEVILYKAKNETPAARRVVDFVFLTDDSGLQPGNSAWYWEGKDGGRNCPIMAFFRQAVDAATGNVVGPSPEFELSLFQFAVIRLEP